MKKDHVNSSVQLIGERPNVAEGALPRAERDYRELVRGLIASFADAPALAADPGLSPTELGVLTGLREVFISAGIERVRRLVCPPAWLQLGVSFLDAEQGGRFVASGLLREAVEAWQQEGLVSQFWFMNKPPGLRLRFLVPGGDPRAEAGVVALLDQACDLGLAVEHEFGLYDAEIHQFGGEAGLAIFHEFSTYDSLGILRFKEHKATGEATIDETVLSLLALGDLLAAVAGDPWEQWDVWCELRLTGRLVEDDDELTAALREGLDENRELLESLVFQRDEVLAELHPTEAAIVEDFGRGNLRVAEALARASRDRALGYPPRKLLPFFIIFHWNRMGLGIGDQVSLAFFMHELLNPKYPRS